MGIRKNQDERQARLAEVRQLYEQSQLSYSGLSKITGIKAATIASWFTAKTTRAPLPYVIKYIRMCLNDFFYEVENGGDFIRHLGNEQLGGFLNDFCSYILYNKDENTSDDADIADGTNYDDINDNASNNEVIKVNYSEVQHLYRNITDLVESKELPQKIFIIHSSVSKIPNPTETSDIVVDIFKSSGLNVQEFASALDIPYGTVLHWIRKEVTPSAYIAHYIEMMFPPEKTCGDIIRHMNDNEIIDFLTDISNSAERADGRIANLPPKYRDFYAFVESEQTELLKPRLTAL